MTKNKNPKKLKSKLSRREEKSLDKTLKRLFSKHKPIGDISTIPL